MKNISDLYLVLISALSAVSVFSITNSEFALSTSGIDNNITQPVYTGDRLFNETKFEEAILWFDKALSIDPNNLY
jgi:hypothetical protein